tara:strand:- start:356 stop:601 length:246 start_codon:yes stop_codon:yes gene_type:complete
MADRNSLHRNKLEDFKVWLVGKGYNPVENHAQHEALRWKVKGQPMPIIFNGKSSEHLSCNQSSLNFVYEFINQSKERINET